MNGGWTLEELTTRMQAVLASTGVDASKVNGQIAEAPNARTVRYYTTIGLLDRPSLSGRVATYGRRHLEQLIAVKRLQAQGKVLAEIEKELVGLNDTALAALAALPDDVEGAPQGPMPKVESRRERTFWSSELPEPSTESAPAPTTAEERDAASHVDHHPSVVSAGDVAPAGSSVAGAMGVTGIQLSDGVTLAFPAARTVDDDDTKALRAALEGVVEIMRARGLLGPKDKQ